MRLAGWPGSYHSRTNVFFEQPRIGKASLSFTIRIAIRRDFLPFPLISPRHGRGTVARDLVGRRPDVLVQVRGEHSQREERGERHGLRRRPVDPPGAGQNVRSPGPVAARGRPRRDHLMPVAARFDQALARRGASVFRAAHRLRGPDVDVNPA
jgi:hypothetical protein